MCLYLCACVYSSDEPSRAAAPPAPPSQGTPGRAGRLLFLYSVSSSFSLFPPRYPRRSDAVGHALRLGREAHFLSAPEESDGNVPADRRRRHCTFYPTIPMYASSFATVVQFNSRAGARFVPHIPDSLPPHPITEANTERRSRATLCSEIHRGKYDDALSWNVKSPGLMRSSAGVQPYPRK